MNKIVLLLLTLFLGGCSMADLGIGGAKRTMPPGGNCDNPLQPVVTGATWDYLAQNRVIGDYSFSQRISAVGEEGFSLSVEYTTGVTREMEWTCSFGDLAQLMAGNGPAGMMYSLGGTTGLTEASNNAGVTLPASVSAGDTWGQSMNLGGEVDLPSSASGIAEGSYYAEFNSIGMEMVTVPAGSFYAMRIEVQAAYDLVISVESTAMEFPLPFGTSIVLWYVPGVGLVKAENTNDLTGYEIVQLRQVYIP